MTSDRPFAYSPIVERPPLEWPEGQRLAAYVVVNVEVYERGRPAISLFPGTAALVPDVLNEGWREYGPRVGVWRLLELFDRLGVPVTGALNADVCDAYPAVVRECTASGWSWIAHGAANTTLQAGMEEEDERAYLTRVVDKIERTTGARPRGWLSPALTQSQATARLLAELEIEYVLDWSHDDQPCELETGGPSLLSLPYAAELNDIPAFVLAHHTGAEFGAAIVDAFDCLHAESDRIRRVFSLGLHPFLVAQPQRIRHLEVALEHARRREGVWWTTTDAVASWYRTVTRQASP